MNARKWFFALGQSHEARGMPYVLCVGVLKLNALPHWVKQAYTAGRLSVQHGGFGVRMAQMAEALAKSSPFSIQHLQDRLRHYDPEATASEGVELNTVDVLTTLHPRIAQDMVPLGVKVNQRYRGAVPMVRIDTVLAP